MTTAASPATTDLSDAHPDRVRHAAPVFRDYGGRIAFSGPVTTLRVHNDNALVRKAVEGKGHGRVLVVDNAGSMECALFGGNLGKLAEENSWAGVVVIGCVRDTMELKDCAIGVKALAAHPKRSARAGAGETDVRVEAAGTVFAPGDWLYADADGIILAEAKLT